MVTSMLRSAIRSLGGARAKLATVALQHLGVSDKDLLELRPVLDEVGKALAVDIELHGHAGDIVLLDVPFASRLSPQLVQAFAEGRPVVLLSGSPDEVDPLLSAADRFEKRQQVLLRQLREIAVVRARSNPARSLHSTKPSDSPAGSAETLAFHASALALLGARVSSAFDPEFDTRADAEQLQAAQLEEGQRQVLQQVMTAIAQGHGGTFAASYGPDANLLFDFNARLVFVDPLAQQQLRVKRELPQPAPGAKPHAQALVCELDETLWSLGLAAGPFPLLDQPAHWWRTPLNWTGAAAIEDFSRLPRHLHLVRCLAKGSATPSELRRQAQVSVSDLRRFIQAGLMLGLLAWSEPLEPPTTGAHS